MYSPFFDKKGKALEIQKIQYKHLVQLKDCEEGHHLEFKRELNDNKAQLAKEIASFANCEGGWLIIGIDDKTHDIQAVDKCDYSQRVGKIATRITPYPEFETRFLSLPGDKNKGVLLIYVYEGKHTPYVCNGVIYVRSGSSKEPIKAAERGNVEYLLEKSRDFKKLQEEFFKRDYYLPVIPILQRSTVPVVELFIKHTGLKVKNELNVFAKRDAIIEEIKEEYKIFNAVQYTMNSILFLHKPIMPGELTYVFELYYDFSCKIYCPVVRNSEEEYDNAINTLRCYGLKNSNKQNYNVSNGMTLLNALTGFLMLYSKIMQKNHIKEKDVLCCLQVENIGGTILYFDGKKYIEYIREVGIPFAHKSDDKFYLQSNSELLKEPLKIVIDYLAPAFGFDTLKIVDILKESNKILMENEN